MMNDLLYLAFNRLEFTRKSFSTLLANTDWKQINRLLVYDDGSTDGTREYLQEQIGRTSIETQLFRTEGLGPVGIMTDYLRRTPEDGLFVKIDNDVMLPPGWLGECLQVMTDPSIDLLGIEAMYPIDRGPRSFRDADYIGGIGLMRRRIFTKCVPAARGRFGFTAWQAAHSKVRKGWLDPALPVCLLNLVPFEPWASLSRQYIVHGWQRDWPGPLPESAKEYWEWWT